MSAPWRTVRVTADMPARLDALLRTLLPTISRRLVRAFVADGSVRVNGRRASKGSRVVEGDLVEIPVVDGLVPEPDLPLVVLHEDADIIAIDKPGGVPGHALDPRERGSIAGALLARHPELASVGDPLSAGLVHRLDTGTSGVLVGARTPEAYRALREAFRRREVTKYYLAIVEGQPSPGTIIDTPLAHDPSDRRRMRAARRDDRAWPARTEITHVESQGGLTLVGLTLCTGVTHQARAHLALLGHPVVGDLLYGGSPLLSTGRHALHAQRLDLAARGLRIESPLPADLRALLA